MDKAVTESTLDQYLKFFRSFISAEYEALVAKFTELDNGIFQQKRAIAESFLDAAVQSDLGRSPNPKPIWFERGRNMVTSGSLVPRRIFQIKIYQHPQRNLLGRIYTSTAERPIGNRADYAANFYVGTCAQELKIISRYDLDILPQDGERIVDRRLSWIRHSGAELKVLGELVEVLKIEPPDAPEHLEEYQAD